MAQNKKCKYMAARHHYESYMCGKLYHQIFFLACLSYLSHRCTIMPLHVCGTLVKYAEAAWIFKSERHSEL